MRRGGGGEWGGRRGGGRGRSIPLGRLQIKWRAKICVTAKKASIHVTANQATVKASLNETFSNMLRAQAVGANGKARHKASQSAPCWGPYKGAVVFALVMFSSLLSIHLAVSTRGPGGKETPPRLFEEVHFRLHTGGGFGGPNTHTHRRQTGAVNGVGGGCSA